MQTEDSKHFSIGVDLGGTNLRIAAYHPETGLLETILLPTRLNAGPRAVVVDICVGIRQLRERYSAKFTLVGIGIGTPGPLELPIGRLHNPPNLPGWDGFNLRAEVESCLGSPVLLESDANAAALAESKLGRGKSLGIDSLCMLTLGTGIGNGIILNGKIWDGMTGMAGEAGHVTIYADGPTCGCGSNGCLEMYASATAVVRIANARAASGKAPGLAALRDGSAGLTARGLAELAKQGDADAALIFSEAGTALGIGLAGLVNTLNLPLYVVGGGLALAWDLMAATLFPELRHRSYVYRLTEPGSRIAQTNPYGGTQILPAELGSDSGILGACILPFSDHTRTSG
jgi:glucokinase